MCTYGRVLRVGNPHGLGHLVVAVRVVSVHLERARAGTVAGHRAVPVHLALIKDALLPNGAHRALLYIQHTLALRFHV